MDMIFQGFLDVYPYHISKVQKGYNILSYIHKKDKYPDIYPKDIYPTRCWFILTTRQYCMDQINLSPLVKSRVVLKRSKIMVHHLLLPKFNQNMM